MNDMTAGPQAKSLLREGEDVHDGAMIALLLSDEQRRAACEALGLDPEDETIELDHCTLLYLTDDAATMIQQKNRLLSGLLVVANTTAPLSGTLNGYGRFDGDDESYPVYLNLDSPDLPALYTAIRQTLDSFGCGYSTPIHGFTPHVTAYYADQADSMPDWDALDLSVQFDQIALVWGGETIQLYLMGSSHTKPSDAPELATPDTPDTPDTNDDYLDGGYAVDDYATYRGGEIKSLGETSDRILVGGWLVRYGDPNATDASRLRDFFTKNTDFGSHTTSPIYYDHAKDNTLQTECLGEVTLSRKEAGIWAQGQIEINNAYREHIAQMIRNGQLGWSSGTASHLVLRKPIALKTGVVHEIVKWPLGVDASLTPAPAEYRAEAYEIKHVSASHRRTGTLHQATGDVAQSQPIARAPLVISSTQQTEVSMDEAVKQALADMATALKNLATNQQELNTAIGAQLKAFDESPALKRSGYVTPDGGIADPEVKNFVDWLKACERKDVVRLERVYGHGRLLEKYDISRAEAKDLGIGVGIGGGFVAPPEYEQEIFSIADGEAVIVPRAAYYPMSSSTLTVTAFRQTDNPGATLGASGLYGGMVFTWNPESSAIPVTDTKFDLIEFVARKLGGLTYGSIEFQEDAPRAEAALKRMFGRALAKVRDAAYIKGTGVGMPLGFLNAASAYDVTRKASGNNVEIEDVSAMLARLLPGSQSNAIWLAHPLTIGDLIQMKIGDTPVFQPDARGPVAGSLLGVPIAFSEYCGAPGTRGDLVLLDPTMYGIAERRGLVIGSSEHYRYGNDQMTWKVTYRGDGQPMLKSTVKLADGANTVVSPFVVLA